jgi:hypothetical protein
MSEAEEKTIKDQIIDAIEENDVGLLKSIISLEQGKNAIHEPFDDRGTTSLMLAALANHAECFKFLLENGVDVNVTDDDGNTVLDLATKDNQCEECVRIIEEYNATPPVLVRGESTVTHQGDNPTCWNHSASKILVRLVFKTLNLPYEESPECDELYDNTIYDPTDVARILTIAKERCKNKENAYLKLLLTLFFSYMSMEKLGCLIDDYSFRVFINNPFNYFLEILNGTTPISENQNINSTLLIIGYYYLLLKISKNIQYIIYNVSNYKSIF